MVLLFLYLVLGTFCSFFSPKKVFVDLISIVNELRTEKYGQVFFSFGQVYMICHTPFIVAVYVVGNFCLFFFFQKKKKFVDCRESSTGQFVFSLGRLGKSFFFVPSCLLCSRTFVSIRFSEKKSL